MAGAPPDEPQRQSPQDGGFDAWSLALLVYFVSLIVIVAALLALPALY